MKNNFFKDSSAGDIYIAINHEGHESKMTNIYSSDGKGLQFNLILMNNVRN